MTSGISLDKVLTMDTMQVQDRPRLERRSDDVPATPPTPAPRWWRSATLARAAREALLLAVLMLVYQGSRLLGGRDVAQAFEHARDLVHLERWLGLPSERDLQAVVLTAEPLVRAANGYYAAAHLPVTGAVLLWLLVSRPAVYRRTRNALIGGTAVALVVYLLVPVAPPRMLPGFVDTAAVHGQSVYGDPVSSTLANQYAALPSLHVGWAVLIALACVAAGRTRWRWLWLWHPTLTVAVVVITANHFWLDAVAGAAVLVLAWHAAVARPGAQPDAAAAPAVEPSDEPAVELSDAPAGGTSSALVPCQRPR